MKKLIRVGLGILLLSCFCKTFADDVSAASTSFSNEYIIGTEDVLSVTVWQHSDVSLDVTVGPDGCVTYPLVGTIKVSGLTREQVQDVLAKALTKYYVDPKVNINISGYNTTKVKVLGMVNTPGVYQLKGGDTLVKAVALAGGLTASAQLRQVTILRGVDKILQADLFQILYEGKISLDVPIMPNDTVFVPDNRNTRVFVLGQVNSPGIVDINEKLTVLEAITRAGSYKDGAKLYDVIVVRKNPKKNLVLHFNIEAEMTKGRMPSKDEYLQGGDVVFVPRGNIAEFNYVLQQTTPALQTILLGNSAYQAIKTSSSSSQVVTQVGGSN